MAALLGGGAFLFLNQSGPGPDDVAQNFIEEIDDNNLSSADEMIHPDSPLDGAGDAANILVAVAGVGRAIRAVDVSVPEAKVRDKSNGQAIVDATIEVDLVLESVSTAVPLDMRKHDGDWHVWNLDVNL